MSDEDLRAEIEKLRAENDQLKTKSVRGLSLKVSEKGAVSLYGVGRFPVTLYKEQWTKILGMKDEIENKTAGSLQYQLDVSDYVSSLDQLFRCLPQCVLFDSSVGYKFTKIK